MEYDEVQLRYADKALEANFALWNALLTINGLILSAAAITVAINQTASQSLPIAIIVFTPLSMMLLVWNFLDTKQTYSLIGHRMDVNVPEMTPEQREKDLELALSRHWWTGFREKASIVLLAFEVLTMALFIFCLSIDLRAH